jgi:hypothetical protein
MSALGEIKAATVKLNPDEQTGNASFNSINYRLVFVRSGTEEKMKSSKP